MRKAVAYLFRYREVSKQANYRYLDALSIVEDPSSAIQQLDDITKRNKIRRWSSGVQSTSSRGYSTVQSHDGEGALHSWAVQFGHTIFVH